MVKWGNYLLFRDIDIKQNRFSILHIINKINFMKKLIPVVLMIVITVSGCVTGRVSTDCGNQDQLILATLWYQKSAEMRALYYQSYSNAKWALEKNLLRTDNVKKPAVVLDIDETVLDNSPYEVWQIQTGSSFSNEDWMRWAKLAKAEALPGAVEFTRFADSLGVAVFYISNRSLAEMDPTIENMNRLGFAHADTMHIMLKTTTSSKVERRDMLMEDYDILLLIGDNLADFDGIWEKRGDDLGFLAVEQYKNLFGARFIMLPNPMYGNWLNELMKRSPEATTRSKLLGWLTGF